MQPTNSADSSQLRGDETLQTEDQLHIIRPGIVCDTESRGHATPRGASSPVKLFLDASAGFVPLWAKDTILRWRFRERSIISKDSTTVQDEIRDLFAEALEAWGTAAPVKFKEDDDLWDFEFAVRAGDECNTRGCVLASAFFPDPGRHELTIYPKMFSQSRKEQVDTFIHETGHIFGLRHWFAQISEKQWPSELFGRDRRFSIMNYGDNSELTDIDKKDLVDLYELVWGGTLTHINRTPVRLVKPYSTLSPLVNSML